MYQICIFLLKVAAVFLVTVTIYHLITRRYVSPYTFTVVFGKKGAGKSCTMQKDLISHYKRGWTVYADSNTDLPFVKKIEASKLYDYSFERNSLICIDEVNLIWDNRDFKNFDKRIQAFFRQQRKYGIKVIAYSQTFDCDKKLRDLADYLAIQKKYARVFSTRRYYVKTPTILSAEEARDHAKICDDIVKIPWWLGGLSVTFIPRYVRKYNTNEVKTLTGS